MADRREEGAEAEAVVGDGSVHQVVEVVEGAVEGA